MMVFSYKLINGPIKQKVPFRKKFLGITEYISNNFKSKRGSTMLIYNKNLSVLSSQPTHLQIKLVLKIFQKKNY